MISKAVARYIRISPRKTRLVADLIKGRYVDEALAILQNTNKRAALILIKLISSAAANTKYLPNVRQQDLYISKIFVDGGPQLKRYKAAAMGRAVMIRKRTSHISLELDLRQPVVPKAKEPRGAKAKQHKERAQASDKRE